MKYKAAQITATNAGWQTVSGLGFDCGKVRITNGSNTIVFQVYNKNGWGDSITLNTNETFTEDIECSRFRVQATGADSTLNYFLRSIKQDV